METLALMIISVTIALAIGIPLGIWAGARPRVERVLRPLLDAMQTIPAYAYLLPLVLFFGIGDADGADRDADLRAAAGGPAHEPRHARRAGHRARGRRLVRLDRAPDACGKVQLPLAKPSIMLGVNQTIMMALGHGRDRGVRRRRRARAEVLDGLQLLNVGEALNGGIAIVVMAIVLDRVTYAWSVRERERRTSDDPRPRQDDHAPPARDRCAAVDHGRRRRGRPRGAAPAGLPEPTWTFSVATTRRTSTRRLVDRHLSAASRARSATWSSDLRARPAPGPAASGCRGGCSPAASRCSRGASSRPVRLGVFCVRVRHGARDARDVGPRDGHAQPGARRGGDLAGRSRSRSASWRRAATGSSGCSKPVLDAMQTMPAFVYLVPVLALFNVGPRPRRHRLGDLRPAAVRSASPTSGSAQVPKEIVEAARVLRLRPRGSCCGRCSCRSRVRRSCSGVNQTIMMALSVVIIAGLIGAGGARVARSCSRLTQARDRPRRRRRGLASCCSPSCSTGSRRRWGWRRARCGDRSASAARLVAARARDHGRARTRPTTGTTDDAGQRKGEG